MPLVKGKSKAAVSKNIATEMRSGKKTISSHRHCYVCCREKQEEKEVTLFNRSIMTILWAGASSLWWLRQQFLGAIRSCAIFARQLLSAKTGCPHNCGSKTYPKKRSYARTSIGIGAVFEPVKAVGTAESAFYDSIFERLVSHAQS